ncbi:uncharacterized protein [Asterias amurensis]|uniref:uncharacterized protein n=1 Tax=Asterias amurensis TaxID=7602 RepID=UPI003AB3DD50
MSELSAKHRALNVLQTLTSDPRSHFIKTSPRPDLSASQEILSGKYRELATLLATQHVERKTVSRLQSVDLVSSRLGNAQRTRFYHDNQRKASQRRQRRKAAQSEDSFPEAELSSCLKERSKTDSTEVKIVELQETQNTSVKNKRVSFSGSRAQLCIDGYASSSTDVSDTEVIRRILCSPRKIITEEANTSSTKQNLSPTRNKKTVTSKKKSRKQKRSPKQPSKGDSPAHESETLKIKEFNHSDHKLNSSSNPDVLSWLKAKNKIIRKQKRTEKKKERLEQLAEQRVAEKKSKKLVESEEKVTEWMKVKKVESILQRRFEKKILREKRESQKDLVGTSPDGAKVDSLKTKRESDSPRNRKSSSKENIAQKKDNLEEEQRHHLVRNLEAERLHAEEKRQAKDAERRRRRLLKEAQTTPDSKGPHPRPPSVSKKLSNSDSKKVDKSISEASPENNQKSKASGDKSKTRPSSNPLKGMTYEDWLKQKQTDQRKQAKDAKKQEVCDPELDELIPLLARRRIEQIKIRATRVDSGLRRSKTPSLESDQTDKQRTTNGERPYTWKLPTGDSSTKPDTKKSGGSAKRKTFTNTASKEKLSPKESDEIKTRMAISMPDVINFVERPEPQGCEGTQEFPCQSPKSNQSNKNDDEINQSEATLGNSKVTSANVEAENESSSSDGTIFLTEPESLKK